jgi:hypothetical protein
MRSMHDNDLLVRRADAIRAGEVLAGLGYAPYQDRSLASALRHDFQLAYSRRHPAGVTVFADLHWSLFTPQLYPVAEHLVWSHVESFDLGDTKVLVLDKLLTLVHLAAHDAQHRFTEPRIVEDLAAAWNRWQADIDDDALVDLAGVTGLTHALAYSFAVAAHRGLLLAVPPALTSRAASTLARVRPGGRPDAPPAHRDYAGYAAALVLARPDRAARFIASRAFPPIESLAAFTGRPVSRRLYAEYAIRPLRPLIRMARHRAPRADSAHGDPAHP